MHGSVCHMAPLSLWDHQLIDDDLQVLLLGVYGGASEARGQGGRAQAEAVTEARLSPKVALDSPSISRTWILPGALDLALKPRQTLHKFWRTLHLHQQDHKKMVNPTMHQQVMPKRKLASCCHCLLYCSARGALVTTQSRALSCCVQTLANTEACFHDQQLIGQGSKPARQPCALTAICTPADSLKGAMCSGGVRIGPGRPQRSWLHRLTATPMITTNGQNWLQVMRTHAAQPGEGADPAADVHAASPVPQLRVTGLPGQNMVSLYIILAFL